MNKHRYHSVEFKKVEWSALREKAGRGQLVMAIDVAKEDFVAALMMPDCRVLVTFKWKHPDESRAVIKTVVTCFEANRLEVILEPSGTYGDPIRRGFARLGISVYRASPKRVHDAAEVYDGVPSLHDAKSAYLIGRLHLDGGCQAWQEYSSERRDLKAAVALMDFYRDIRDAELNRLEALLARHWPEVLPILERGSVTLLTLLVAYGSPATIAVDREDARCLMKRTGRWFLVWDKIEHVLSSAGNTMGEPCTAMEKQQIQVIAKEALRAHRAHRSAERQVEHQAIREPLTRPLVPVVGKVTSVVLVASQGTPTAYPGAGAYLKGLGLNLKERSSGKHKGRPAISKRGPGIARKYLFFATLRLIRRDPIVKAWYQRKVQRDGQLKSKAIMAVTRKLAKALWYVAQGQPFDSTRLFDTRHLRLNT